MVKPFVKNGVKTSAAGSCTNRKCESFTVISRFCTHIQQEILSASIFRILCLQNCKQTDHKLSWQKSFWRLDIINAVLWYYWYKQRNWSC